MRKKIYSMLVLGALFLTASCSLHDDNEVFDTPAAQRIEESIAADKALLESAANGWELHLWMGEEYSSGGYTYFLKFNNDKVTVASEIADADMTSSSSYDIIADAGPVLTIDTYNTIFHERANPESDGSQLEQDYEFVISRTTNDSIYLRGKKYGNHMVMTRVPENVSWSERIEQIKAEEDILMATFKICNGTDSVGTATLDPETRNIEAVTDSGTVDISYYVTPNGIVLQKPITVKGMEVQNLIYNDNDMSFSTTDTGATALNMQAVFPANYMYYDEYPGTYVLSYSGGTERMNVTLTPAGDGKTYLMSGFLKDYNVRVNYHKPTGTLRILAQQVGVSPTSHNPIYMLTTDGSSVYFSLSAGFSIVKRTSRYYTLYIFQDLTSYGINGFYLAEFSGAPSNATYMGASPDITFSNSSIIITRLNNMQKVD